jgi:hypothetical protein
MLHKPPAPSEPADYRWWRRHAEALIVRLGVPAGPWSRERDLRQLYISGATPEDAVRQADTLYWNTRPPFERTSYGRKLVTA